MLRYVLFDQTLWDEEDNPERTEKTVVFMLEALVWRNQEYLRERPNTKRLYRSGVTYKQPQQFAGDCDEVKVLRDTLGASAKLSHVKTVLETVQDVLGGERFRDIGRVIENGGGDCFPLSQKIIARSKSTGYYELLSIGELRFVYQSYEALSYNFETRRQEFKDIVGWVDKGVKPVSKAHLSNGTDLISTDDHVFWTLDGSRQQRPYPDSFRLGQRTMGEYVETYTDWQAGRISDAKRGYRSRILQASSVPALGAVRPSQAEAYLAGMYAAEGEFSDGKHTRIGQHKPRVREKIEAALAEVGTSFHYAPGRGRTPGSGAQYSLHGGAANPLVAMMREQGHDSFDKRLPQAFLSADAETVAKMLEGHGDGDAWRPTNGKYKRPNIDAIYATSSDELMEQLRFGTLILGRPTYNYRYEDHGGEGNEPIWRLHEYNENASKLRARAEQIENDLALPGLRYGTVRNAVPFGEAHVGCIEVEDNHNFFLADGTLAKNCDNLAAWRVAELRQGRIPARPYMTKRRRFDGGVTYHALVIWPSLAELCRLGLIPAALLRGRDDVDYETSEDPSLLLGMGGARRIRDRAEEIRKNRERCDLLRAAKGSAVRAVPPAVPSVDFLEEVLGLRATRPRSDSAVAEIDRILKAA